MTLCVRFTGLDDGIELPLPSGVDSATAPLLVAQLTQQFSPIDAQVGRELGEYIEQRGASLTLTGARTRARRLVRLYVAGVWRQLLRLQVARRDEAANPKRTLH
jgi:hypothetical protein